MTAYKPMKALSGIATAIVLVVLFVLSVLGFALGSRGTVSLQQVYVTRQQTMAYYAAQSGIMLAIEAEVQSDAHLPVNYCGGSGGSGASKFVVSSDTSLPVGYKSDGTAVTAAALSSLQGVNLPDTLTNNSSFSVTITDNSSPASGCSSNVTAPDGTVVPPGKVYITSKGTAQGKTKVSNVMVPVTPGTSGTPSVNFNYAVFSKTSTTLSNNTLVDSYNSSYGAYNCSCGGIGCTCSSGYNIGSAGNIGTDSNANASVTLTNNTNIKGEVDVGPGGTAGSPTISASNNVTYSKAAVLSTAVTFPTVTDPVLGAPGGSDFNCSGTCSLTPNTLYNNITASNNAIINVPCGNYSMNSISLANAVTININCSSGTTSFYVHGTNAPSSNPISFSNNTTVTTAGAPKTFQVYDLSSATSCSGSRCTDNFANNGSLNIAYYAQNANVNISNNGVTYGSVIGYTVTLANNNQVHYDSALSTVPIGNGASPTPAVVGNFTIWNFQ